MTEPLWERIKRGWRQFRCKHDDIIVHRPNRIYWCKKCCRTRRSGFLEF